MKTEKQLKSWLKVKLDNLSSAMFMARPVGIQRARTRLKTTLDQLDEYLKEGIRK